MKTPSEKKSLELAVKCLRLSEELAAQKHFVLAKQLSRSGTSVGANIVEAKFAESKKDFIHKMKIAEKELSETAYWIELVGLTCNVRVSAELLETLSESKKIVRSIVLTAKANLKEGCD